MGTIGYFGRQKLSIRESLKADMNTYKKYPSTPHLTRSQTVSADDIVGDISVLNGKEVVITEKRDGENTTMYSDHYHARSIDSNNHPSRNYVKGIWAMVNYKIPAGYRVCGENLYAKHSIFYEDLSAYFEVFNVWNGDECLSWNDTIKFVSELGLICVPVMYQGIYSAELVSAIINSLDTEKQEGIVIRNADSFKYEDFTTNVFKWVRKNHVQTDEHWMNQKIVPNKLIKI